MFPRFQLSDFITGDNFRLLCDIDTEKDDDFERKIREGDDVLSVFVQTHELKNMIPVLRKYNKKFVLVTHNSDGTLGYGISGRWFDYTWKNESNIVHWFSQNVEVKENNVTPIPIALENEYIFPPEVKQQTMVDLYSDEKDNKVFLCFNIGTNDKVRGAAWRRFECESWATCQTGFNNRELVEPYFKSMAKHKYVVAPDGNGIDTIRIWEALYMGCIPIVNRHVFTEYYAKQLPMIIVDNYRDITLQKLNDMNFDREYNWDMLKISYWKTKILETKNAARDS